MKVQKMNNQTIATNIASLIRREIDQPAAEQIIAAMDGRFDAAQAATRIVGRADEFADWDNDALHNLEHFLAVRAKVPGHVTEDPAFVAWLLFECVDHVANSAAEAIAILAPEQE